MLYTLLEEPSKQIGPAARVASARPMKRRRVNPHGSDMQLLLQQLPQEGQRSKLFDGRTALEETPRTSRRRGNADHSAPIAQPDHLAEPLAGPRISRPE